MLIVISPAKTLDFDTPAPTKKFSQPQMLDDSQSLINLLTDYSPNQISKLMSISPKLAELNRDRFETWSRPFKKSNAKQAILAFKGDVYIGLEAENFSESDFAYAQEHLRILSGLYGALRPLDLMRPYRLEMGTRLKNAQGNNLYDFWDTKITEKLNKQLKKVKSETLLNLASNEYFKSVKKDSLNAQIVTPVFKDWKTDKYKMISFFAKKARGMMSAWVIQNQIENAKDLKKFKVAGYKYSASESTPESPVYLRKQ